VKKKPGKNYYQHNGQPRRTVAGRVVYARKRHAFNNTDLIRIFKAIIRESPDTVTAVLQIIQLELDLSAGIAIGQIERLANGLWQLAYNWIRINAGSVWDSIRDWFGV
jgi:hypothetical protein